MSSDFLLLFLLIIFAWEGEAFTFFMWSPTEHIYHEVGLKMIFSWLSEALESHVILLLLRRPEERGWPGFLLAIREPEVNINQPAPQE